MSRIPIHLIIRRHAEPLHKSGVAFVAYREDVYADTITPLYIATETREALIGQVTRHYSLITIEEITS